LNRIDVIPRMISSDIKDVPYIALSLSLGKAPIWSFDKKLAKDCEKVGIKVFTKLHEIKNFFNI